MPQSPMTELEAVNLMLSVIGETPVNTLTDAPQTVDVAMARQIFGQVINEVQAKGYNFNMEYGIPLNPDGQGNILIPSAYTRVQLDGRATGNSRDVIQRGNKLYDRGNRTYVFTTAVTVRAIVLLPFDQMPEAARRYCTIRSARVFADRVLGDQATHVYSLNDERDAKTLLDNEEGEAQGNSIFDNWSVSRTLFRSSHALPVQDYL